MIPVLPSTKFISLQRHNDPYLTPALCGTPLLVAGVPDVDSWHLLPLAVMLTSATVHLTSFQVCISGGFPSPGLLHTWAYIVVGLAPVLVLMPLWNQVSLQV